MSVKKIIVLFIILASCTPSPSPRGTDTPSVFNNSETPMPMVTPASCPPASLIYDLHAPKNIDELIGQYFSHPIPQPQLEDIQFRVMRSLSNSSSHVLAQVNVGHKNTLMLGKFICDAKLAQKSPQTYSFYQTKSVVLLPSSNEHEYLSLNCSSVDGVLMEALLDGDIMNLL